MKYSKEYDINLTNHLKTEYRKFMIYKDKSRKIKSALFLGSFSFILTPIKPELAGLLVPFGVYNIGYAAYNYKKLKL